MSKDDSTNTESQGIPGYSANSSVPGGFALPLPTQTSSEEPEQSSDPWSSTWDDATWQLADTTSEQPVVEPAIPARADAADAVDAVGSVDTVGSVDDWAAYDHGGDPVSPPSSYVPATTSETTDDWSSWREEEPWQPSSHWSDLQHDAEVADQSTEEYSGWVPAGGPSQHDRPNGVHYSPDHDTAIRAHAAVPSIDPDVAAAAAELGTPVSPVEYDLTPVPREGNSDSGRYDLSPLQRESGGGAPSAEELIAIRSKGERQRNKASGGIRKAFGMGPGLKELVERDRIDRIARPLNGRKTIMVINTKGGGGKTLVTLMLATYLGRYRSGSVLAWDNNETEGTLGMRAPSQSHHRTVVDLLGALPQIASDPNAGTSELEHWVREQRGLSFDVLASADDDEAMRVIGESEFEDLHTQLSRFYRMIIVDTGNNRLSPNWLAAAARADMLVFATSLKDDTSVVAAKNLDALVSMGRGDLVRNAVCVISHTAAKGNDIGAGVHTREHFEQWVRAVVDIPYDPALAPGLHLDPLKISKKTHECCMEMAAVVVDGL